MTGTVPRVHPARLPFGRGYICVRHLPLHTDGELKHQEHRNRPVSEPVTHGSERTPRAAMGEGARLCRKPGRAAQVRDSSVDRLLEQMSPQRDR
jgi:hypothetical protein